MNKMHLQLWINFVLLLAVYRISFEVSLQLTVKCLSLDFVLICIADNYHIPKKGHVFSPLDTDNIILLFIVYCKRRGS